MPASSTRINASFEAGEGRSTSLRNVRFPFSSHSASIYEWSAAAWPPHSRSIGMLRRAFQELTYRSAATHRRRQFRFAFDDDSWAVLRDPIRRAAAFIVDRLDDDLVRLERSGWNGHRFLTGDVQ